jgi:hypothetical protein
LNRATVVAAAAHLSAHDPRLGAVFRRVGVEALCDGIGLRAGADLQMPTEDQLFGSLVRVSSFHVPPDPRPYASALSSCSLTFFCRGSVLPIEHQLFGSLVRFNFLVLCPAPLHHTTTSLS